MRVRLAGALLALLLCFQASAAADKPESCPYCNNDPALMQQAGIVSHGPFEFGSKTTEGIQGVLATFALVWIESSHFEIGLALPRYRLKVDEKKKIVPELERLAAVLPEVSPSAKELDPWLRAHLYAQRAEETYARFKDSPPAYTACGWSSFNGTQQTTSRATPNTESRAKRPRPCFSTRGDWTSPILCTRAWKTVS